MVAEIVLKIDLIVQLGNRGWLEYVIYNGGLNIPKKRLLGRLENYVWLEPSPVLDCGH
jgi:hypothetical protein